MDRIGLDEIEREIDAEARERFPGGAVRQLEVTCEKTVVPVPSGALVASPAATTSPQLNPMASRLRNAGSPGPSTAAGAAVAFPSTARGYRQ